MMPHRPRTVGPAIAAIAATLAAACSPSSSPAAGPSTTASAASTTAPTTSSPHEEVVDDVTVIGLWSGPELESFMTVTAEWERDSGVAVNWQGEEDLAAALARAIESGDPPDVAVLPNPGLLHDLARDGALVPLESVLDIDEVRSDYSAAWLELGSYDGQPFGIPYKVTDKSVVWYSPVAFGAAGYETPATWDELIALADRMVTDGKTPFSVVAPASPAAGWALTDWVAQLVLSGCGIDQYDAWVAGDIPWTDPCIEQAFRRFDQIVHTPGYVLGGDEGIRDTTDADGSYPMYTEPPAAYLYYMASFAQAFISTRFPDLTPGDDYATFPFPALDVDNAGTTMIGADIVVIVDDTPAARSFVSYLAGPDAQQTWIELGGFTSVNRRVPLDAYPDPVARSLAEHLATATHVRFASGDLFPFELQRAWWDAMMDLVSNPDQLDAILPALEAVAQQQR